VKLFKEDIMLRIQNLQSSFFKWLSPRGIVIATAIFALLPFRASAAEKPAKKISIAVLDFETKEGVSKSLQVPVTDKLSEELFNTGKYRLLDRKNVQTILHQQGINSCTSSDCAVEVGQLLSVDKIVTGSISKIKDVYMVNASMTNVGTGEVDGIANIMSHGDEINVLDVIRDIAIKIAGLKEGNESLQPDDKASKESEADKRARKLAEEQKHRENEADRKTRELAEERDHKEAEAKKHRESEAEKKIESLKEDAELKKLQKSGE
jgi:hypothetical protein